MSNVAGGIPSDPDMLDIVLREDWERLPVGYSKNIARAAARREVHRLRNEATKAALLKGVMDEGMDTVIHIKPRGPYSAQSLDSLRGDMVSLMCDACGVPTSHVITPFGVDQMKGGEVYQMPCHHCGLAWTVGWNDGAVALTPPNTAQRTTGSR